MSSISNFFKQLASTKHRISLLILDGSFPQLASAFAIAEINHYLDTFKGSQALSNNPEFESCFADYRARYPALAPRVSRLRAGRKLPKARLAYSIFLKNTAQFLPLLHAQAIPFVMTLYPGGGLGLGDPGSDAWLKATIESPLARKIIVTQSLTRDYLVSQSGCDPDLIEFIYGMVVHESYFSERAPKRRFGFDKSELDVCFAAYRYMPLGADKGYDTFISAAARIAKVAPNVRFHVLGNFDEQVIDVSVLGDRIRFHGILHTDKFQDVMDGMDLIVSPNVPMDVALSRLGKFGVDGSGARKGKFDGFPTGSCVEAALCGVGIVCSDFLRQNEFYEDGKDLQIIAPDADSVVDAVLSLRERPDALRLLGETGRSRCRSLFSPDVQLGRRRRILDSLLQSA